MNLFEKRITIVTGHYGCGKTNIAVNFALWAKGRYRKTVLIDLDIVNPYFRASDNIAELKKEGISVLSPNFANTNLDTPSLPPSIAGAISDPDALVIIDVGGDDAGAIVLGQYAEKIKEVGYELFYTVSQRRPLTATPEDAKECLTDIEAVSKLKADSLINNTNLGDETDKKIILSSLPYAEKLAALCGIEKTYTCARADLAEKIKNVPNLLSINLYTKKYF